MSSITISTFTSSGSEDFKIKLLTLISYIPGGRVYPADAAALYFVPSFSATS